MKLFVHKFKNSVWKADFDFRHGFVICLGKLDIALLWGRGL